MLKSFFIFSIKCYQLFISPCLPNCCRYEPSCSEYAILSLKKYGIIRGSKLALKRILSCHPYGGSGYDPLS